MNISDGFSLWAGKALFDLAVFGGIIATAVAVFFGFYVYLWVREKYRAIRKAFNGGEQHG